MKSRYNCELIMVAADGRLDWPNDLEYNIVNLRKVLQYFLNDRGYKDYVVRKKGNCLYFLNANLTPIDNSLDVFRDIFLYDRRNTQFIPMQQNPTITTTQPKKTKYQYELFTVDLNGRISWPEELQYNSNRLKRCMMKNLRQKEHPYVIDNQGGDLFIFNTNGTPLDNPRDVFRDIFVKNKDVTSNSFPQQTTTVRTPQPLKLKFRYQYDLLMVDQEGKLSWPDHLNYDPRQLSKSLKGILAREKDTTYMYEIIQRGNHLYFLDANLTPIDNAQNVFRDVFVKNTGNQIIEETSSQQNTTINQSLSEQRKSEEVSVQSFDEVNLQTPNLRDEFPEDTFSTITNETFAATNDEDPLDWLKSLTEGAPLEDLPEITPSPQKRTLEEGVTPHDFWKTNSIEDKNKPTEERNEDKDERFVKRTRKS